MRRSPWTLAAMGAVRTGGVVLLLAGGAVLAGLCLVWPAGVALAEVISSNQWAEAALGTRRIGLLVRGLSIAGGAAVLAQVLGAGLAAGLTCGSRAARGLTVWVCLVVLLTPPYVYAYAWSLLVLSGGVTVGVAGALRWPAWLVHEGRAVWCLGTWAAPVAAILLACGWRAAGRPAYALALPDASAPRALWRGARGAMWPWVAVGLIVCSVLASTEHTVCDLSQAPTWNTEILAEIQNVGVPGTLLAWPLVVLVALLLLALWPFRGVLKRLISELADLGAADEAVGRPATGERAARLVAVSLPVAIVLLPGVILAANLRDVGAFKRTWVTFPHEWPDGLLCAAGSALVSIWLAVAVDYVLARGRAGSAGLRAAARAVIALAAVAAMTPAAAVGDAFAAAYVRWPPLGDYWPVVSLVTAARFAIIPLVALRLAGRIRATELTKMAAADGAGWSGAYFRVRLPLCLPVVAAAGVVVGLLALMEVPASLLVRPPGVESVALTLFNHMHYGRNDEIVALSLYVMTFVAVVVGAGTWLFGGGGRPSRR